MGREKRALEALVTAPKSLMIKNAILNTGSTLLYFFLQWLTTVLAVRFADFETAGIYALAISFTNLFYFLALFGMRNYQISDIADRFSQSQYTGARIITALAAALTFFTALLFAEVNSYALKCYSLYMVYKLGEAYTEGYFSILQRRGQYKRLAGSYTAKACLPFLLFAGLLRATGDLFTGILGLMAGYIAAVAIVDVPRWERGSRGRVDFRGSIGILRQCLPLMAVSLTVPVMNYITRSAVEREMNYYYVGQYASLSSVIVVMSTLAGAIFVVLIPEVSSLVENSRWRQIRRLFALAVGGMMFITAAAVAVGKLFGPAVCSAIFGPEILESIGLLVPLLVTASLLMIKSFFSAMLVPLRQKGMLLVGECSGALLCSFTAGQFTRLWGMQGANLSYLVGIALQVIILGGWCFWTTFHHEGRGIVDNERSVL